ncbi:MAG: cytochrome c biogenesis protein CcdA [Anaerolineae bacterium]|nr:cytochrome c biogenesis protein CcdA [Anaerolineae bacterium]
MDIDPALLQPTSILGYFLVFLGGIVTSIGPCNVAMIPLIIGFIGGSHDVPKKKAFSISLVFTIGLAVTFMLLGIIASLVGGLIGGTTHIWYYLVAVVCFVIGLQMLGVLKISTPMWFGGLREKVKAKGLFGAFLLGLISGLVASQCATPVLAAILTYVMAQKAGLAYGAVLLFLYSLGRGVPIILAGTFTGVLKSLRFFGKWSELLEKVSGGIIILVGLYFLWIA